jgi:hypothetical protein
MIATLVTLGIIISFSLVGIATMSAIKNDISRNDLFVAPALGFAVIVIPAMFLTRNGIAGQAFALPLIATLSLLSVAVIALRRPPLASLRSAALPVGVTAALTLFVVGFPQLHYGFSWLSFSNDDMVNYSLDAIRLIRLPEFAPPLGAHLLSSSHPDEWTWFIFAKDGDRYGFDLVLALVGSITSRSPFDVFMSLILGLHLCVVLGATALFARDRSDVSVAFIAGTIALAPANVVAAYYQLGPQVAGVALLAAAFYFFAIARPTGTRERIVALALGAVTFGGLLQVYPELVGVFGVSLALVGARSLWPISRSNVVPSIQSIAGWVAAIVVGTAILGFAGINALCLLITKTRQGAALAHSNLSAGFNTSVTSSGFAALFGLIPIDMYSEGRFASLEVAAALLLFLVVATWVVRAWFVRDAAHSITLTFSILLVLLVVGRNGYGAFKAILYVQPFLFGTLADIALGVRFGGRLKRLPLAAYCTLYAIAMPTLFFYMQRSDDPLPQASATYTQIANASATDLSGDLHGIAKTVAGRTVVTDSNIESLTKIENSLLAGNAMRFPGHDPYGTLESYRETFGTEQFPVAQTAARKLYARTLLDEYFVASRQKRTLPIDMPPRLPFCCPVRVSVERPPIDDAALLLYQGPRLTVLNRSSDLPKVRSVGMIPYKSASNILVFVDSSLGTSPNFGRDASIFEPEPDYFFPGTSMSAVGRTLLFEILNPSRPRLELWLTRSVDPNGDSTLPEYISVYGTTAQRLRVGGRGSARVVSAPITPIEVDGHKYIALDLEKHPEPSTRAPKSGIALLFNSDLVVDQRPVVGFARDISAIDVHAVGRTAVPELLSAFPADLRPFSLQYSGMYEDGWVSKDSWFELRSDATSDTLTIEGEVPAGVASDRSSVQLDGRRVWNQQLVSGNFVFTIALPKHFRAGLHRIEVHFSNERLLGNGDMRTASAVLTKIGFQPN